MSECMALRDSLDDVALGGEPSAALHMHLDSCPQCARTLERRRAMMALIDAAIRKEVAAQPAQALAGGVLARVRARPRSPSVRFVLRLSAAVGAAVAAIVLAFHFAVPPAPRNVSLTDWHSPTAALLEPTR